MVLWVFRHIVRSDVGRHLDLCLKIIIGYLLYVAWLVRFSQVLFRSRASVVIIALVSLGGQHLIDEVLPREVGHHLRHHIGHEIETLKASRTNRATYPKRGAGNSTSC
uniref:Uncharacterized protein n=1 Tax=Helianthus annuus TaxID=4232 RepID=A0A251V664_HELAN